MGNIKPEMVREGRIVTVKMLITVAAVTLGSYLCLDLLLNYNRTTGILVGSSLIIGMVAGLVGATWATKVPPRNSR